MLDKAEGPVQPTIADTQAGHGVTVCSDTYILIRPAGSYLQSEHCLEPLSGQTLQGARHCTVTGSATNPHEELKMRKTTLYFCARNAKFSNSDQMYPVDNFCLS